MDGTLLRGTTASTLVAAVLGKVEELAALELRFASGEHSTLEFARALHDICGIVESEVVAEAFATAPVLRNLEAVLGDIHAHDERACLITMSPDYFAELFLPYGFDAIYASRHPRDPSVAFDPDGILAFEDKPRLAAAFCAEHGFRLGEAVAYGDSMSDVPLFATVGYGISVNGDRHLEAICDSAIEGDDLWPAYQLARRYIDGEELAERQRQV
jgi:phosphoserine phosphatase